MAPTLAATPLTDFDSAWRLEVAGLPAEARARLLAEADALYLGGRDDRRRALACWLALRDQLDPLDPADRPRVQAVLDGVPPGIEDLGPLARRAEASGDPDLGAAAAVALGRIEADAGRIEAAETRFRAALAATRGTGSLAEYLACSSLAELCLRGNREFEALVLARRLVALAAAAGKESWARYAHLTLACALEELREWDLLQAPLRELARSLEGKPPGFERTVRIFVHILGARLALARGNARLAAEETEAGEALERIRTSLVGEARVLLLLRARIEAAGGRFAAAEGLLERAAQAPGPRVVATLDILGELVRVRFETRGAEGALGTARDLLRVLEEEGVPVHGSGRVLAVSSALGGLLLRRLGDGPEARRAFDAAAAAVLHRIHEVNRCLQDLPELSAIEPGDEGLLRANRVRFVREHQVLLERVRERLVAGGVLPTFPKTGPYFKVCAWCTRILGEGETWVPVAHYLPLGPDLPVSHGICPNCAGAFLPR